MTETSHRVRERRTRLNQHPESVRWARNAKGWKSSDLADAVGISKGHMSEIEAGTRNASVAVLGKIAEVLNCPTSLLEAKIKPPEREE